MFGWYVIQVQSGRELAVAADIRQRVEVDTLRDCFAPRWQTQQKRRGEWRYVERNLIPGYVIAVTSDPQDLEGRLKDVPGFTKMLRSGGVLRPLAPDEVSWFNSFARTEYRVIPMSTGIKEGDHVIITDGPLKLHQTEIKRIDRRRSTAYVEISILGRKKTVPVGLKILVKREG